MAKSEYAPPRRKEPGLIGRSISFVVQFILWLIISCILSILIEWVGIAFFWPEQGEEHASRVLATDISHLNAHLHQRTLGLHQAVVATALGIKAAIPEQAWLTNMIDWAASSTSNGSFIQEWAGRIYRDYRAYFHAAITVSQIVVVRLALIFFSLPAFFLFGFMGAIDGLVERDLRRWGGGRESSNVFNLARRSVAPSFIGACVLYISVPFSIQPALILMPFALMLGLAVRVSCERLKKYF